MEFHLANGSDIPICAMWDHDQNFVSKIEVALNILKSVESKADITREVKHVAEKKDLFTILLPGKRTKLCCGKKIIYVTIYPESVMRQCANMDQLNSTKAICKGFTIGPREGVVVTQNNGVLGAHSTKPVKNYEKSYWTDEQGKNHFPSEQKELLTNFEHKIHKKPETVVSDQGPTMNANPSLRPTPTFSADADAEALRKTMKGFGTNNQKVIQVICGRTNWERQEINKAFKVMYGKDLIKDLKSELSGDFEDLILALMEPPAVYDANQLHKAMAGLGTKEFVLIEIMCSRTNAQIQSIKMAYNQIYGEDLERELIGETSGNFKRLLTSLCAGGRDESSRTDTLKANQDARALYRAGEQRLGTDESTFNAIFASQNYAQLRLVFAEYQRITNHSIEQAISAEFSGDIKDGLLAIVNTINSRAAFFAELLYNSMRDLGTRDNDLIRIVVTRAEIDLRDICTEYQRMYKTSLENAIADDCSGNYKEGLIALVKGNY